MALCFVKGWILSMKKYIYLLLVAILASSLLGTTVFANDVKEAKFNQSTILLDGKHIWCNGFKILGNNYFKLRDLAENLSGTTSQFDVFWNDEKNAIEIITGKPYTSVDAQNINYYCTDRNYSAKPINTNILVDGKLQSIIAFNIDGCSYFKLRDLGNLIPFDVDWDSKANEIIIFSQIPQNAYRVKVEYEVNNNIVSPNFPRWGSVITSYLLNNKDKTISVIEANNLVTIETYNEQYNLIAKKSIEYELPIFGGFYSGEKYNYIAFGQDNYEENDDKEVIRIVRYDKNFKRIDSVSIKGGESITVGPFNAGSGRMAEYGNRLVFHTSRIRYTTEDGLNHQSQLTIIVNTSTMKVTNDLGRFQSNHVSHSFAQYVLFDNDAHVLIDHGDAYPRSIVLHKEKGKYYSEADLFKIPGKIGANCTGVSVGGFEISSANYIVAMNTIDHSLVSDYTSYDMIGLEIDQRDIILCILPKNNIDSTSVKQAIIKKYVGSDKNASIPQLLKISDDKLMVMWQEYDNYNILGDLKYVLIDKDGNTTSEIKTIKKFKLSKGNPIVVNNKIIWYVNENGIRIFYSIPF